MADQVNTTKIETNVAETVKAAAAPAKAVVEAADKAVKAATTATAATARKARVTATKRRARKAPVTAAKATRKTTKRAAKTVRNATKATVKAVNNQTERTIDMTNDFNTLFGAYKVPATEGFQNMFSGATERSQEIVAKTQRATEEMSEIARANMEALTEAGRIAATGARSLGQDMLTSGREGIERVSTTVKTLAEAKSPTEFIQIQSELARASFDRAVSESSKFAEAFVKLAGETMQPLSTRATLNAERMGELAA